MSTRSTYCADIFQACDDAMNRGVVSRRASPRDKEFHFQDWFADRLKEARLLFDDIRRLKYPDFALVEIQEGYEVKGLGWPGRWADFDANSQVPSGFHNGRDIYYVFGRYPSDAESDELPVIDLVICHGDFLNARHDYVHKNDSFRGFGTYGDILIRDRKMYVAPTPFALTTGTTGKRTLIVPNGTVVGGSLVPMGELFRTESDRLVTGYSFDLTTNVLTPQYAPNPSAGLTHPFTAYQVRDSGEEVRMAEPRPAR